MPKVKQYNLLNKKTPTPQLSFLNFNLLTQSDTAFSKHVCKESFMISHVSLLWALKNILILQTHP